MSIKQPRLENQEEAHLQEKGAEISKAPPGPVSRAPPACTHLVFTSKALLGLCHQTHRPVSGTVTLPKRPLFPSPNSPRIPPAWNPGKLFSLSSHPC